MKTKPHNYKVNIITLGCSKNVVDSEVLLRQLKGNKIEAFHQDEASPRPSPKERESEHSHTSQFQAKGEGAGGEEKNKSGKSIAEQVRNDKPRGEVVVINTCGFIERAKEESINTILQYVDEKKAGRVEKVFVTGCLSHRYKDDLEKEIPDVDGYFGTLELPGLLKRLGADYKHELIGERIISTPQHYAYLKISEGCNRTCSFCAIPLMRGQHVSKTMEAIVAEAKHLASHGTKELMLIAQELTYYGLDIYKKRMLPELLLQLSEIEGIEWVRLHYAYPNKFPLEILDAMNRSPKVCNYLDIPLQHISNNVLAGMKRQITKEETIALVNTIREKVPGITLRTTMLVGFPGETEKDFEEVMQFVEQTRFDRLGVFTYSHEEGTSAYQLKDSVPAKTKKRRMEELMALQEGISTELNQAKVGKTYKTLFDRKEGNYFIGRTEGDSPEVDNEVLVDASKHYVRIGDFANVKITRAEEFDLYGEVVN
ncbi:MAG: 30S ribosomal protein S12 methylthiotransferase RimO [Chitinophagales bacterium]|nr:30S ribosomal protein S12 methylthiotransferase RimO [Chitinophagales bacterium]